MEKQIKIKIVKNNGLNGCWGMTGVSRKDHTLLYITFNTKELKKYPHILDEIIVHEFCHTWTWLKTGNLNHSRYWKNLMKQNGYNPFYTI